MKIISTKTHAALDYIVGALLILTPWIFHFYNGGPETWIPVIIGFATIIYSVCTKYELGIYKIIPFNVHLAMDAIGGAILIASPWVFNFQDYVYRPHVFLGIFELVAVALSAGSKQVKESHNEFPYAG